MFRPLRIEYPGAYYHVYRELRRRIEQIREMASSTSIQKRPDLFLIYPPERIHEEVQAYASSLAPKPAEALAAIRGGVGLS